MKVTKKELLSRLSAIEEMIDDFFDSGQPVLLATAHFLNNVRNTATLESISKKKLLKPAKKSRVVISCAISTRNTPEGLISIGSVIRLPVPVIDDKDTITIAHLAKAETEEQAKYAVIYESLVSLFNMINNPKIPVEVRSDSETVVQQLNGEIKCPNKTLARKRDAILEFASALPVPIVVRWMPSQSTKDLLEASRLALSVCGD